jgi:hypothetical protein
MDNGRANRERSTRLVRNKRRREKYQETKAHQKQLERARKANQENEPYFTIVWEDDKKRKREDDDSVEKSALKKRLQIAEERVRELEEVLLTIWPKQRPKYNDAEIKPQATLIKREANEIHHEATVIKREATE